MKFRFGEMGRVRGWVRFRVRVIARIEVSAR